MKTKISILILIAVALNATAQPPMFVKKDILPMSLKFVGCFSAGVFRSHVEILDNSYQAFEKKWPNADPTKFNPELSWKNKYKDNDPTQGPKFLGSTTTFVGLTDWKHGFQSIEHVLLFTTVSFSIGGGRDKILWQENKWKYLGKKASECAAGWIGYNLGFSLTRKFYGLK